MICFPWYRVELPLERYPDSFTVSENSNGKASKGWVIDKGDKNYTAMRAFFETEKTGWSYDVASYAPHLLLVSPGFIINCRKTEPLVIINYRDKDNETVQISKNTKSMCPAGEL